MTLDLHLRIALALVSMLVSTGCASRPAISRVHQQDVIAREGAVRIAKEEIRKRRLAIKNDWIAKVEDSLVEHEFVAPRPIFTVSFYRVRSGARAVIYRMNIDEHSGNVEDFIDMRTVTAIRRRRPWYGEGGPRVWFHSATLRKSPILVMCERGADASEGIRFSALFDHHLQDTSIIMGRPDAGGRQRD